MSGLESGKVLGIVLAGGRSQRMGGGDKGFRDLAGRPMLAYVVARLTPQVGRLILNANGDLGRFSHFALPVVPDARADFPGPLAGVLAGMRWAAAEAVATRYVVTVPSDAPFLPVDLVARLTAAAEASNAAIAMAQSGGVLHPVVAAWRLMLADALEAALEQGERRVGHWAKAQGAVAIEFDMCRIAGRTIDPFFNANTPEDLEKATELMQLVQRAPTENECATTATSARAASSGSSGR